MSRLCKRCKDSPSLPDIAYCKKCKNEILDELTIAGYLETGGFGRKGQCRTATMKENTYETKHGTWQR